MSASADLPPPPSSQRAAARTRVLLWLQLAASAVGAAAGAVALDVGRTLGMAADGGRSLAAPALTGGVAAALLLYLALARRPRRGVLVSALLLPAAVQVAAAVLVPVTTSFGLFTYAPTTGWFGWSTAEVFRLYSHALQTQLWAVLAATLIAVANAVLLLAAPGREPAPSASAPDT
ncbi:hypothetical protein ACFPZ0_22920 [Streptomonospora nanhaiensis]|uniref:Uncharacterized protein n=1 Tax=Streptomonospora nanhaiensis TaxID=1323731 RepID=A0A853BGT0_9ACTN|nr:hypothetical protein [Streptomonospora nanhaiensis]MBV2363364.1 hypothetical protein [Streptomonospora nanhaiensis]MBX9389298.1 hypothetical protein [Streptomonospora nanhaiensis]NYI94579.1 hypothetical protein [Streptomonospora nanhaiensis]